MLSLRSVFSAVIAAFVSATAFAAKPDTTLTEVVVTATRTPTPVDEVLAPIAIITRDELARSLNTDVADILRMQAGVELSRPGGIGQSVSVFIRGANASHTLVLLDGVRMNPGTIGTASLQNIPPETIERIEIVKGPRSALYGSDAIGGVINIITRKRTDKGISAEAEAGYGSYDTKRASGLFDATGDLGNAGVSVAWLKSDGFPTRQASGIDTGYDNLTASAHAGATLGPVEIGARIYQATGTADYLNSPTAFVSQDYLDRVVRFDAASQVNDLWRTQAVLSRMDNTIEQNDPVSFPAGEMDYLETHRNTIDWQNDLQLADKHRLTAGVMFARETAHALSFGTFFDRDTDITNVYVQHQYMEDAHALLFAAGYTDYSTFGGHFTWNAEYGYSFTANTKLIAAAGSAFHAPTATDLYGFGGNPALDPEKSRSFELSLRQRITDSQAASLTAFENNIDDLIMFDSNLFIVRNIARARIRGLEARYEYIARDWRAHIEATYQDPRDRDTDQHLLRRAKKTLKAGYSQSLGKLQVGADVMWSGPRLDSRFPGTVELHSYVLANINARYTITEQLSMIVQFENVFNTRYELASGYNTAGRGGSIAARWNMR